MLATLLHAYESGDELDDAQEGEERKDASLEEEADLKQFLKVVRPEWSVARPGGGNQLQHVIEKLRSIGIRDTQTFVERVFAGTINTDLFAIGRTRFSQQTIETVKRHRPLMQALDNASKGPYLRQTGMLNPVKSLLSRNQIVSQSAPNLARATTACGSPPPRYVQARSSVESSLPSTPLRLRGPPKDTRADHPWLPQLPDQKLETQMTPESSKHSKESSEALPNRVTRFATEETPEKSKVATLEAFAPSWSSLKAEARVPGWQEDDPSLSLTYGEDMLKEQAMRDDHFKLMRMITKNNPGVRLHVIGNIKSKMQREKEKGAADSISTDQQLFSIKSNIEQMSTSRRELARVRNLWHGTLRKEDPRPDPPPMCADLALQMKQTMLGKKEEQNKQRQMSLAMRNSISLEGLNPDLQAKARASIMRNERRQSDVRRGSVMGDQRRSRIA